MSHDKQRRPVQPRRVTESVSRAIIEPERSESPGFDRLVDEVRRQLVEPPQDSFTDGVRAEKHLREDICPNGASPLGPYIPVDKPPRRIGGEGRVALFEDWMLDWFDEQTPETMAAVTILARKQVRAEIFRQILKDNWLRASAAGSLVFGTVQWGSEVFGWVREHLPVIQGVWRLVKIGVGS